LKELWSMRSQPEAGYIVHAMNDTPMYNLAGEIEFEMDDQLREGVGAMVEDEVREGVREVEGEGGR
jgi:hypothetical protein